jgi:hypothetical protein
VIAANETELLIKAHGAVIPVKHPQEDGPHSGKLQVIENLVDHAEGIAVAPESWSDPHIFQETLISRSAGLARDTSHADRLNN